MCLSIFYLVFVSIIQVDIYQIDTHGKKKPSSATRTQSFFRLCLPPTRCVFGQMEIKTGRKKDDSRTTIIRSRPSTGTFHLSSGGPTTAAGRVCSCCFLYVWESQDPGESSCLSDVWAKFIRLRMPETSREVDSARFEDVEAVVGSFSPYRFLFFPGI